MDGDGDGDDDRLRECIDLPQGAVVWWQSPCEVWFRGTWRRGTLVATPARIGVVQDDDKLLALTPEEHMSAALSPRVVAYEPPPLQRAEEQPLQLWIPCTAAVPDAFLPPDMCEEADPVPGIALRNFPLCRINPKRVARLITFIWEAATRQPMRPDAHHHDVWAALHRRLGAPTGAVSPPHLSPRPAAAPAPVDIAASIPRALVAEVVGAVMFPEATRQLTALDISPPVATLFSPPPPASGAASTTPSPPAPSDVVLARFSAVIASLRGGAGGGAAVAPGASVEAIVTSHRVVLLAACAGGVDKRFVASVEYADAVLISQVDDELHIVAHAPGTPPAPQREPACEAGRDGCSEPTVADPWTNACCTPRPPKVDYDAQLKLALRTGADAREHAYGVCIVRWAMECTAQAEAQRARLLAGIRERWGLHDAGTPKAQMQPRDVPMVKTPSPGPSGTMRDMHRGFPEGGASNYSVRHLVRSHSGREHHSAPQEQTHDAPGSLPKSATHLTVNVSDHCGSPTLDPSDTTSTHPAVPAPKLAAVRRLLQHFTSLQHEGYVCEQELIAALTCVVRSEAFPKTFLRVLGEGHDRLSFAQFLTGMLILLDGAQEGGLYLLFSLFDWEQDAELKQAEWSEMLGLLQRLAVDGAQGTSVLRLASDLYHVVPKQRIKTITLQEFSAALTTSRYVATTFKRLLRSCLAVPPARSAKALRLDFGDPAWPFVFDLLDGLDMSLRHAVAVYGQPDDAVCPPSPSSAPSLPSPAAQSPSILSEGNLNTLALECTTFVKASCGAERYQFRHRSDSTDPFASPAPSAPSSPGSKSPAGGSARSSPRAWRSPMDIDGAKCAFYDFAPHLFHRIRLLSDIPSHLILESLGLKQLLVNLLLGGRTAPVMHAIDLGAHRVVLSSHDARFFVKTVPEEVFCHFLGRLPAYYTHLANHPDSILPRYYGMFALQTPAARMCFVIMGRPVVPAREVLSLYELKGSFRDPQEQFTDTRGEARVLLKDDDVKRHIDLDFDWHRLVSDQVEADLQFLADCGFVGYSMWLGLDSSRRSEPTGDVYFEQFHNRLHNPTKLEGKFRVARWCCCCRSKERVLKGTRRRPFMPDSTRSAPRRLHSLSQRLARHTATEILAVCIVPNTDQSSHASASNAFQLHFGGTPTADRSETVYLSISDLFACEVYHGDTAAASPGPQAARRRRYLGPKQYAARLGAWTESVFRRTSPAEHVDLDAVAGDSLQWFDAMLVTRHPIHLVVDPTQEKLYLLHPRADRAAGVDASGRELSPNKCRAVCAPYTLRSPEFSFHKPLDKTRKRLLTLRGTPCVRARQDSHATIKVLDFLNQQTIRFKSLHDREEFCALCSLMMLRSSPSPPPLPALNGADRVEPLATSLGAGLNTLNASSLSIGTPSLQQCAASASAGGGGQDEPDTPRRMKVGLKCENLRVYLGTWNVGNLPPGDATTFSAADLNPWLGTARQCHVVAVGAQECDYKPRKPFNACSEDWCLSVQNTLNDGVEEGSRFILVAFTSMWQIRLMVYVRESHAQCISDVMTFQEATGIAHVAGNKGGVAVGLKYLESPLLFVSCHLAAHQGKIQRRHSDIDEIIAGISHSMGTPFYQVTTDYHHIFWVGDLNYRIDTREDCVGMYDDDTIATIGIRDRAEVQHLINTAHWGRLHHEDQLIKSMNGLLGPKLLPQFVEAGDPAFPPTFKMFSLSKAPAGVDLAKDYQGFDKGGSKRVPSWCDRILRSTVFSHTAESSVRTLAYDSCTAVVTSDHRPVFAMFDLKARAQYPLLRRPPWKANCKMAIQLRDLSPSNGEALCAEGFPSLCVYSNFCTAAVRTGALNDNMDPMRWTQTLTLVPEFGDAGYLQTEYLYFAIYRSPRDNEILGQCVVCLEHHVHEVDSPILAPIYIEGRLEGCLTGKITVVETNVSETHVETGVCSRPVRPAERDSPHDEASQRRAAHLARWKVGVPFVDQVVPPPGDISDTNSHHTKPDRPAGSLLLTRSQTAENMRAASECTEPM